MKTIILALIFTSFITITGAVETTDHTNCAAISNEQGVTKLDVQSEDGQVQGSAIEQ